MLKWKFSTTDCLFNFVSKKYYRFYIDFCIEIYTILYALELTHGSGFEFVKICDTTRTMIYKQRRTRPDPSLTFLVVHVPDVKFRQKQAGNVSLLRNYPIKSFRLESSWIEMELLSVISPLMMRFNSSSVLNSSIIKSRFCKYFGEYYSLFRNYYYSIKIIFLGERENCLLSY